MIMQDALPGVKRFLAPLAANAYVQEFLIRFIAPLSAMWGGCRRHKRRARFELRRGIGPR
jgi:hypothetical protein